MILSTSWSSIVVSFCDLEGAKMGLLSVLLRPSPLTSFRW